MIPVMITAKIALLRFLDGLGGAEITWPMQYRKYWNNWPSQ